MSQVRVSRVTYHRAFLRRPGEARSAPAVSRSGSDIPARALESILKEDALSLGGQYGEPSWGDPIEFDRLVIEHESGRTEITVFNRGIHLIMDNTETIRRIHRVCVEVGLAFGGPG